MTGVWVLAVLAATAVQAEPITFDFDDQTATRTDAQTSPGALTSLQITQSGLTITITREGGVAFDIVQNNTNPASSRFKPGFGEKSLDPFFNTGNSAFLIDLSAPVTAVSVDMGDYGQDTDTLLIEAYSGPGATGSLLDSARPLLPPESGNPFSALTVSLQSDVPIVSLRLIGGTNAVANSVYYDNLVLTPFQADEPLPVPEPPSLVVFGLMGLALWTARRRLPPLS